MHYFQNALAIGVVATLAVTVQAELKPLLTTIAGIDDLSTFTDLIKDSGGNKPNPAYEERFNSLRDKRNYTAFVPTNAAFAKLPHAALDILISTPAYELTEAIIRTHIAEGLFSSPSANGAPIIAIEGFPLSLTATPSKSLLINNQSLLLPSPVPAANGLIYKIDTILNPFTSYFGVSPATSPPSSSSAQGTLYDLVQRDSRLSQFKEKLGEISPRLLEQLDLAKPNGEKTVVAIPGNDAFAALPQAAMPAFVSPSNRALSEFILVAGFGPGDKKLGELGLEKGKVAVETYLDGWNVTVAKQGNGVVRYNNAAVQCEICVENGCAWILDRVPDVLFEVFGPNGRSS
ncbi:Hypothetical protein D9617_21g096630 [Elsinoe fawcettii]|nr:Hypothetical protein D9617_21g096630 [Elsinoe fawcettii]